MSDTGCFGPGREPGTTCGREIYGLLLCWSHYVQVRRAEARGEDPIPRPLGLPLRERRARAVIQVRVSDDVLAALRAASADRGCRNLPIATAASEALEEWALSSCSRR